MYGCFVAAIEDAGVARRILAHRNLPTRAPPRPLPGRPQREEPLDAIPNTWDGVDAPAYAQSFLPHRYNHRRCAMRGAGILCALRRQIESISPKDIGELTRPVHRADARRAHGRSAVKQRGRTKNLRAPRDPSSTSTPRSPSPSTRRRPSTSAGTHSAPAPLLERQGPLYARAVLL